MKHQPFPEPLGSIRLADCLACVPSKTPVLHWRGGGGDSLNFASPKSPNHSPEMFPAQQKDANLQSGLLAPYAISTQDTAKQALKGNQSHECLTNSLTHTELQLLPPPQQGNCCKREGSWHFGKRNPGKYPSISGNKYCRQALHKGWGRNLFSQH